MRKIIRPWIVGMLIFVLVSSALVPSSYLTGNDNQSNEELNSTLIKDNEVPTTRSIDVDDISHNQLSNSEHLYKVSPSLREMVGKRGYTKVYIATTNIADLARVLEGHNYNGLKSENAEESDKIIVPLLEIPFSAIPEVAALPDVMAIFEYSVPEKHYESIIQGQGFDIEPLNLNSTVHHRADKAWERNFTGDGIKIAVVDDGVDFAHPDLMGTQARVETIHSVEGNMIIANATGGETYANIDTPYSVQIVPGSYRVYKNSVEIFEPANYSMDVVQGNITLISALATGDNLSADYEYYSPYYNWPLAFDPFSMTTFLSTNDATDTWYSATNTTNENVTHTIKMDGTNDFWDDGTELIAADERADIISHSPFISHYGNDFDLVGIYVTHDLKNWYIGLESYANHTNMTFGIYINTTVGGAEYDPLGNYVNATEEHRPEYAIYIKHKGSQPYPKWADNDTLENATIFKWDGVNGSWSDGIDLINETIGGEQSYSGWKPDKLEGFIELMIPKRYLDDDGNISLIAFTTNYSTPSQPQDTVDTDPAVTLSFPNLTANSTITLSSFTIVGNGFWNHTYRPIIPISGRLNKYNMSWPIKYITTNTSKSDTYYFGDLPDENYPQTRVLVVDEAVAGVYDTVYVDMDHNKDFRNDKPVKRLGKYDDNMTWHDVDWQGDGTIYDELVYADWFDSEFGITSLDYSPNGSYLASGGNDHKIILWRTTDYSIYKILDAHIGRVTDVKFSPNGEYIAASYENSSGHGDFHVIVWNFTSGIKNNVFRNHTEKVTGVAWSPSGTEIVSSSLDSSVVIWNITTNQRVKTFNTTEPSVDVDWSIQDRIAVGVNYTIKFWNSTDAPTDPPMEVTLAKKVSTIAFNSSGDWLAVGTYRDHVYIINVSDGDFNPGPGLGGHAGVATVKSISWSSDSQWLITTAEYTETVVRLVTRWPVVDYDNFWWDTSQGTTIHSNDVLASAFSPSGTNIATGSKDIHIKILQNAIFLPQIGDLFDLENAHTLGAEDKLRYDTGDGLPDVSGGLVYYIATNNLPIPYSETYTKRLINVEKNVIPKNGQMVAFMGAMDTNQGHGTLVASTIVGQGKTYYHDDTTGTDTLVPNVIGFAPNAKIIPVANIYMSNIFDGWYFAVEGLDGEINTGDEALIVGNSFGFSNIYPDGWNFYDRFVDWLVTIYAKGRATFVVSAGNDGYGYGTVTTPAASTGVITVGASTDFGYRPQSGLEKGPYSSWGDVATLSSRGPTAQGKPDPDLVANGRMSFGSTALNQVTFAPNYNGTGASELWMGTSLSAPTVSGTLALVYEAYRKAEHLAVNETLSEFKVIKGNNVTTLWHTPIRPDSYTLYRNQTLIPKSNYTLFTNNGTLILYEKVTLADNITVTYRFYDDYPDAITARSILMSSADDINFDVLSQGAGFLNVERAVNIANNISGVMITPNTWTPGDYKGEKYESFITFMKPGTSDETNFTAYNSDPTSTVNLNITDMVYHKVAEVNYTIRTTVNPTNNESQPHWTFIITTNLGLQNVTSAGVYDMTEISLGGKNKYKLADIDENIWLNTELLKITAAANQSFLDPELDGNQDHNYWLDVYDWTCIRTVPKCEEEPELVLTGSEELNRINMDNPTSNILQVLVHNPAQRVHDALGMAIRPVLKGDKNITYKVTLEFYKKNDWNWLEVDNQLSLGGASTPDGIKTFSANLSVPSDTPIGSYQGGIYIYGNHANSNETTWGRTRYPNEIIMLEHANIITNNPAYPIKVYRNSTLQTETVNYTVYPKTGIIKLMQNITDVTSITVDYWYHNVTTIPILVNVPAEDIDFEFGDNAPGQDELFMNKVIGGFGDGGQSGDWRFYYIDLPDEGLFAGEDIKFLLNISWEMNLTDIDAFSFGKGGSGPVGILYPQDRYGPLIYMENKGGSEETGSFYTTTNTNREIVIPPLTGGLNIIAIHNVRMNGTLPAEKVHGEVGMMEVVPSELKILTSKLDGSRNVTLYSSRTLKGLSGVAAGPSAPERIINISIKQDDVSGISTQEDFIKALADGDYTKFVNVQKSALIFSANITSLKEWVDKPCKDLDLGIFLDGKGPDNVPDNKATDDELVTYDADQDAEERVKIVRPTVEDDPDTPSINEALVGATYIIKVLGYDTSGQCLFNIDVNLVQGEGFEVQGTTTATIPPYTVRSLGITWQLPPETNDGEFMGAFYIGPSNAPMALLIPIELTIERADEDVPGETTGPSAAPQLFNFEIITTKRINYLDGITTNDNTPTITISISDSKGELDWQSVRVYLDNTDITCSADIDIPYEDPDGRTGPLEYGYWNGVISYTPAHPFADKTYLIRYEVKDLADNLGSGEYMFVIDTIAPSLDEAYISPSDWLSTQQSTIEVSGETDQFATVFVRGENLTADDEGYFSTIVELEPGVNEISITAVDWFDMDFLGNLIPGNSNSKMRTIIRDEVAPIISSVSNSTGTPTKQHFTTLKGSVSDSIGIPGTEFSWDPKEVELTVNGIPALVHSDGSFKITLKLVEGNNAITLKAEDAAHNKYYLHYNITKDVTSPTFEVDEIPAQVSDRKIKITGVTEEGAKVLINGQYVSNLNGSFSTEITLNTGSNTILIEVTDEAGNTERRTYNVNYFPEEPVPYYSIPLFVVLFIIILMIGWRIGSMKPSENYEEETSEEQML